MPMNGLECFGMFYMGWGTGDSGMLREILECFGRLWNVTGDCGMLREILECYGRLWNVTVKTRST